MKLSAGYTLEQLLTVYRIKAEIPESLSNVKVSLYGASFIEAVWRNVSWVDEAVKAYLKAETFVTDLQFAEECWKDRLEHNGYWLQLECGRNRKIRLCVYMD